MIKVYLVLLALKEVVIVGGKDEMKKWVGSAFYFFTIFLHMDSEMQPERTADRQFIYKVSVMGCVYSCIVKTNQGYKIVNFNEKIWFKNFA